MKRALALTAGLWLWTWPALAQLPPPAADAGWDWADAVIYFALTDRFHDGDAENNFKVKKDGRATYHGGDWQGLIDKLGYLQGLGVNALWITAVNNNVPGFLEGHGPDGERFEHWAYHGYWPEDFETPEEHHGTEAKLKELVDKAHERGIRVLFDVVVNHVGYGSAFYRQHPDWFHPNVDVNEADMIRGWLLGLPDLKTEDPEVAAYLTNAWISWIDRTGVDGFRLDTVKHVDHPFWKQFRKAIHARYPDFFLLGEVYGAGPDSCDEYLQGDELDACLDFSFGGSVLAFLQGRGRTKAFNHYLSNVRYRTPSTGMMSHYLDSHDVDGWLHLAGGDKSLLKLAAVLQMTTIGIPNIYYGNEVGRTGQHWPVISNRSFMPWGEEQDEDLLAHYTRLIHIRRAHRSLSRGPHEGLSTEGDLYVYRRSLPDGSDKVIVALNRGSEPAEARLELAGSTRLVALLAPADLPVQNGAVTLQLPGRGFAVFQEQ
jgi:glycosidase